MADIPVSMTSIEEYDPNLAAPLDAVPPDNRPALELIRESIFDGEVLGGVVEGRPPGVQLLAMTNRRLILLESATVEGRLSLTSVPAARITSVGLLADRDDLGIGRASTVAIKVLYLVYELHCRDHISAREVHDELAWNLILD
jgi:hypothetical protein